jgi:hypothetical protein
MGSPPLSKSYCFLLFTKCLHKNTPIGGGGVVFARTSANASKGLSAPHPSYDWVR